MTEGRGLAAVASLPGLDAVAEFIHDPRLAAAFENAPARLALRAVLAVEGKRRMLLDVAGLRANATGRAAIRCLKRRHQDELDLAKAHSGLEPFEQIDEVAWVDGLFVARGRLAEVNWSAMRHPVMAVEPEPFGERGQIYNDGVATWGARGEEIVLLDFMGGQLRDAIHRIEGRAEEAPELSLGGTLGLLPARDLFDLVPMPNETSSDLSAWLSGREARLGFAVQTTNAGVEVVARFNGDAHIVELLSQAFEDLKAGNFETEDVTLDTEAWAPDGLFHSVLKNLTHRPIEGGIEASLVVSLATAVQIMGPCAAEDGEDL